MQLWFDDQPHELTSHVMARLVDWPTEAVVAGRSGEFVGRGQDLKLFGRFPMMFGCIHEVVEQVQICDARLKTSIRPSEIPHGSYERLLV